MTLRSTKDVIFAPKASALNAKEHSSIGAVSVMRALIDRGIAPERLKAEGRGETQPVASNETEEGRAKNRRIEIEVR